MQRMYSCITLEHLKLLLLLAIGFTIGYTLVIVASLETNKSKNILGKSRKNDPTSEAIKNVTKIRILCYLHTRPPSHANKAIHVRELWGKHCDKLLFASTSTDTNLAATAFNVKDSYDYLWGKTKFMMQHIYNDFINDYDWFFKGDDDTFLIAENMRYLLSAYSTDDPIYFGHKYNTSEHKRGFFSGGSGYVMSRKTVRIFVENVLTNKEFMKKNNKCHVNEDKGTEDWYTAQCLDQYDVYAGDARDLFSRERFIPMTPDEVFSIEKTNQSHWYIRLKYYARDDGANCCSHFTNSFHYVHQRYQYRMYYLTYRMQPYGVIRLVPPLPQKKIFAEVAHMLDLQRFNKTLRGF